MSFILEYMKPEECQYAYHQSTNLNAVTGSIGCFRGCLTFRDGIAFERYWDIFSPALQTPEFENEFRQLISALKTDYTLGQILSGLEKLNGYCAAHAKARIEGRYKNVFGFRIETENYLYLLRINTTSRKEDFCIYAYQKSCFLRHVTAALGGIAFYEPHKSTPHFTLQDGDLICIYYADGTHELKNCRYLGFDWIEVNGKDEILKDFVWKLNSANSKIVPIRRNLPYVCFFCDQEGQLMEVRPGGKATVSALNTRNAENNRKRVKNYNKSHGVTPAQYSAMIHGATHSWCDPEADPAQYNNAGVYEPKSN